MCLAPLPEAAGRLVTFRSFDGRTVTALYVEARQRPAPAVVLVPMLGGRKEDWQLLADRLAAADITALAVDLPGAVAPMASNELGAWHSVVGAGVEYLFSSGDVHASAIGVAGASLGASLAVIAAASDARVRSLALVSPSLDYRGVRIEGFFRQYGGRPAFLLASRQDPYAVRSVRELAGGSDGLREVHWAEAAAHGTALLGREPDLARAVVEWFQRTLPVN